MAVTYRKLITEYCAAHGIAIPPGFGRNKPSRYVIIRTHLTPPKLVALTWFSVTDVLFFIQHRLVPEFGDTLSSSIQILDFKTAETLIYNGGKQLKRVGTFSLT